MWVRKSAIRLVPDYARVSATTVDQIREELIFDGLDAQERLDDAYEAFEGSQVAVSTYVADTLGRPLGDAALALGYFLSLSVWMAFDRSLSTSLASVTEIEFRATKELFELDQSLRASEPQETLETDDVVAMEQPALVAFLHEQIEATLDSEEVDPDELQLIYRMVLIEILALSYAVEAPAGYPVTRIEATA